VTITPTGGTGSFNEFLSTIGQISVLTKADEQRLAKRIEMGDERAKDELVRHNIRLAVHVARRYQSANIPFEDIVQEGILGVIRAAEKFDWRKDIKFSTYATWWIRHFIQRALYKDKSTIRVPGHITARRTSIDRYLREHPDDSLEMAAAALGMSVQHAEEALDGGARVVASLDAPLPGVDGPGDKYDFYADDHAPDPADVAEDPHPALHAAMQDLTEIERKVIELRFGFTGAPMSRDEVAGKLGVRPHVVQRSQRSGIAKLRETLGELPMEDAA
jgi:RNA polymerase primary sigma factor